MEELGDQTNEITSGGGGQGPGHLSWALEEEYKSAVAENGVPG